ncbi:MAG: imidazolonepropionase [Solirubrobacterales bacterium]|nr:imidazolonepropionase [Solirubrobacterales bacterium]
MAPGVCLRNAEQVLRPPEDGLPYLRGDRSATVRLDGGCVAVDSDRIVGFEPDASAAVQIDARGCAVVPGLVDCHTHLPFAGWRAREYVRKVTGVPYAQIAREGGGIAASAGALAEAGDDEVLAQATGLAAEMLAHGTTTFECKSGYGLSVDGERRALGLAGRLDALVAQQTTSTALLAHAVPPGFTDDGWMDTVAALVPELVRDTGITALDIFVESIAFANEHLTRMGALAAAHGLHLRAHVEQLATHGSVPVALAAGARSVDHLSHLPFEDVALLAGAECAAVLLPGAEFLGAEHLPPARELAEAGAICVLATDANPGTSPIVSLPLIVGLAVRRYGWDVAQALLASTLNAAWVLDRSGELGSLEVGKRADVVLLDAPIDHVPYRLGHDPVAAVLVAGELAWVRPDQAWRVVTA